MRAITRPFGCSDSVAESENMRLASHTEVFAALGAGCSRRSVASVDDDVDAVERGDALARHPELFGDADRGAVQGVNHAREVRQIQAVEGELHCGRAAFGGQSLAPVVPREQPTDLERGPTVGMVQTDAPHECTTRFFLSRPHAVAAELPMAKK